MKQPEEPKPKYVSAETRWRRFAKQIIPFELVRNLINEHVRMDDAVQYRITCQGPHPDRRYNKPCGRRISIINAYKCLYCGFWFCETCAEIHFGKTKAQFQAEQEAKCQSME